MIDRYRTVLLLFYLQSSMGIEIKYFTPTHAIVGELISNATYSNPDETEVKCVATTCTYPASNQRIDYGVASYCRLLDQNMALTTPATVQPLPSKDTEELRRFLYEYSEYKLLFGEIFESRRVDKWLFGNFSTWTMHVLKQITQRALNCSRGEVTVELCMKRPAMRYGQIYKVIHKGAFTNDKQVFRYRKIPEYLFKTGKEEILIDNCSKMIMLCVVAASGGAAGNSSEVSPKCSSTRNESDPTLRNKVYCHHTVLKFLNIGSDPFLVQLHIVNTGYACIQDNLACQVEDLYDCLPIKSIATDPHFTMVRRLLNADVIVTREKSFSVRWNDDGDAYAQKNIPLGIATVVVNRDLSTVVGVVTVPGRSDGVAHVRICHIYSYKQWMPPFDGVALAALVDLVGSENTNYMRLKTIVDEGILEFVQRNIYDFLEFID